MFCLVFHTIGFMTFVGAIFFIWEAASKSYHNKRCYKQREMKSSIFLVRVAVEMRHIGVGREGMTRRYEVREVGVTTFHNSCGKPVMSQTERTPESCSLWIF